MEEHPYRKRLWHLLIEALPPDDRRVEAMRACSGMRRVLAEAGLDITHELRDWENQILGTGPS